MLRIYWSIKVDRHYDRHVNGSHYMYKAKDSVTECYKHRRLSISKQLHAELMQYIRQRQQ